MTATMTRRSLDEMRQTLENAARLLEARGERVVSAEVWGVILELGTRDRTGTGVVEGVDR